MFATPAYAQSVGDAGSMGGLAGIIPFILMFVIFYFLLIRPQQKRMKEHKKMIENLRRGDQVVTSGGLMGKVTRVTDDDEAELQIAEGVKVRVVKSTIAQVVSKTEPAAES